MKEGDVIVCIDTSVEDELYLKTLTMYKSYKVLDVIGSPVSHLSIIDDYNDIRHFKPDRFIYIAEWREKQLNEIGIVV